jgi:hypothetical protein
MKHSIFICEDYTINKDAGVSILVMVGAKEFGKVDSIESFNAIVSASPFNAICCPDLMVDEDGDKIKAYIFSK